MASEAQPLSRRRASAPPPPQYAKETLADCVAAAVAGVVVSPVCAATDKAIAESLAGQATLWSSFFGTLRGMAGEPLALLRRPEMRYVTALFAGTYALNNLMVSQEQRQRESLPTTKTGVVFVGNMGLAMWKDAAFARLFGGGTAPRVPPAAFGAWAARDVLGMTVIFTLPPLVAPHFATLTGLSHRSSEAAAQVALPILAQPLVGPLHQLGYLLSYQPGATFSEHLKGVRQEFVNVVAARVVRIFPPYCIGATANKDLRLNLRLLMGLPIVTPGAPLRRRTTAGGMEIE